MRVLIVLVSVLLPLTALAGAYRWTDKNGRVHFSDKPPAGTRGAEEVPLQGPEPIGQGESVHRRREALDKMRREREERQRKRALEQKREEQQRLARCQRHARRLSRLQNNRVRYRQNDGSYRGVDEDRHQARIRELEQWLRDNCSGR